MLVVSLVLSILLLLIVNGIVGLARVPGRRTDFNGLALSLGLGSFVLMVMLPAVGVQSLLMCVALSIWRGSRRGPSLFPALS